ncbi:ATP-binding protein [Turicibacter sanguinis]|uniref:sensor histidine kinase n=1 Tax=Turicibacter sanguinis TaxID=154288 RepID=UPI003A7F38F9
MFLNSKLHDFDEKIKMSLQETGFSMAHSVLIKEKLITHDNDGSIQKYTLDFIENLNNVDLIVVADMNGIKYSHLDESQIGQVYVGSDKQKVLATGERYFSIMEGSQGKTLRWFEPIFDEQQQIGFVMVGKYYRDITVANTDIMRNYVLLCLSVIGLAGIGAKFFSSSIQKRMLNMEPEEIARLYRQKKIIIESVADGIIALDASQHVIELNNRCNMMIPDFNVTSLIQRLDPYIDSYTDFTMKEFIIQDKRLFINLHHLFQNEVYLGSVITLMDRNNIHDIAKEITGIDEVIKNLRVTIHEFKNNLHVILGLIQLDKVEEAKSYILTLQQTRAETEVKFHSIEDPLIRALLMSRSLVAKERQIEFTLTEESFLYPTHQRITAYDLVTIIGNLLENAFEACSSLETSSKKVEISLYEDETSLEIQVRDNGEKINPAFKDKLFESGISTKGEHRGIGLFLVKNRVELYHGTIEIEDFDEEKIFVIMINKGEYDG